MELIRKSDWAEVYKIWEEAEKNFWQKYYEGRGQKSWEEFRSEIIRENGLTELSWGLYRISLEEIPFLHAGPFPKWQELSKEIGSDDFNKLSGAEFFKNHPKVEEIKKDLKNLKTTYLIAVRGQMTAAGNQTNPKPETGASTVMAEITKDLVLLEGHHRCVALAQMYFSISGLNPDRCLTRFPEIMIFIGENH